MANVINRNTKEIRKSIHTPDYQEPVWMIINGKILPEIDKKYWKIVDNEVVEMNQDEKDIIDFIPKAPEISADAMEIQRVKNEIDKEYPIKKQLSILFKSLSEVFPNNTDIQKINEYNVYLKSLKDSKPYAISYEVPK